MTRKLHDFYGETQRGQSQKLSIEQDEVDTKSLHTVYMKAFQIHQ
jgi:hypothetical protein